MNNIFRWKRFNSSGSIYNVTNSYDCIVLFLQAEIRTTQLEEEKAEAEEIARDKTEELSETIGNTSHTFIGIT